MMNPMHTRRDDNQVQKPLELDRQTPVGMMKEDRSFQCEKEDYQHYWSDAEDHHGQRKESNGKNHLTKVESRCSAYVQIEIGVMHVMKPPEEWNHMVRPMPPPIRIIHQQKRCDGTDPKWKSEPV